jgi:hypothetical protein
VGVRYRDVICQTRTLAAPGARCHSATLAASSRVGEWGRLRGMLCRQTAAVNRRVGWWREHMICPRLVACELLGLIGLDLILCHKEERTVGLDNVVVLEGVPLQLPKQPGRRTCARLRLSVRRPSIGTHSVWGGPQRLGRYDVTGARLAASTPRRPPRLRAHHLTAPPDGPRPRSRFPPPGSRAPVGPSLADWPGPERTDHWSKPSGHFTCQHQPRSPASPPGAKAGAPCCAQMRARR